jgi:hypothetical protein
MFPDFSIDSDAVVDYSLTMDNVQVRSFAKGDLSTALSYKCVQDLKTALESGDKIEWFKVILASVTADSLFMEIVWRAEAAAEVRKDIVSKAEKELANTTQSKTGIKVFPEVFMNVGNEDYKKTTLSSDGIVVLGYMTRSLQPKYME